MQLDPLWPGDVTFASLGLDAQRDGEDLSTLYVRLGDVVYPAWRRRFPMDVGGNVECATNVADTCRELAALGVTRIHVRVDTSGGYGGGPADILRRTPELLSLFSEFRVFDIVYNKTPRDPTAYYDTITELYAVAAECLKTVRILDPPPELEEDITDRRWVDAQRGGSFVRKLEQKSDYKKRYGRSPDDGDGLVMAIVPPEALGYHAEVEYPVRMGHFDLSEGLEWLDTGKTTVLAGNNRSPVCCGADQWLGADGHVRILAVVRRGEPDGRDADVAVAYLWQDPWKELLALLLGTGASWCVVHADGEAWQPALDFADHVRVVKPPRGSRWFRRTYLARWRGNDARPKWRDKPVKELALKGDETGYKYVVDAHRAQLLRWSLERRRDGMTLTPPTGDLWAVVPHCGGRPEPALVPAQRETGEPAECCLGAIYQTHVLRTGFRRGDGGLEVWEPFGGGFAVAGALADVGLERMRVLTT